MDTPAAADQLEATAVLADPVRRALYLYVTSQAGEVSRDQAAEAVRIDRSLAAFHLDKLVEAGLLDASYRRLSRRTGPGAGRPNKLYRPSAKEIDLTLPERRYALLARLLAGAVGSSKAAATALDRSARDLGQGIGAEARAAAGPRPNRDRLLRSAEAALRRMGFQPYHDDRGTIRLRNCPFDAVAKDHRDIICGANLELMEGVLNGLHMSGISASLEPTAGMCCVALRARARS